MKYSIVTFIFILFGVALMAQPMTKSILLGQSNIIWKGYKVTGSHEGNMKFKSGTLSFNGQALTGGEVSVDMNSIDCTDMQGGGKAKLEGHLKSDDFFGVASHPFATIKLTKVVSRGTEGEYKVTGSVTIKNITKEIKFNATAKDGTATATIKLDRADFDIKYGSGSFFDNLGDKTIYDEFDLVVTLKY